MTITPLRQGTHECELPTTSSPEWHPNDVIRCDTCGRCYRCAKSSKWDRFGDWERISRFEAWLFTRSRKDKPDPTA